MRRFGWCVAGAACTAIALVGQGCGSDAQDSTFKNGTDGSTGSDDEGGGGDDGGLGDAVIFGGDSGTLGDSTTPSTCVNLQCQQHSCGDGGSTTVTGKVYDPAGKNPLYNVVVYVPNTALSPLAKGASCDSCDSLFSGSPIAATITDASGSFTLTNVPDGANIPLVLQVGKWRRQVVIPTVAQCQDNPQADKSLRLPKNQSEGDIPNIAISTGGADTLECLLSRIGVDGTEYGGGAGGTGHIHIFKGAGGPNTSPAGPTSSSALWTSKTELMKYDIVLLSCEGSETASMNQQAMHDYASAGGRVFSSHFHYAWFNTGPYAAENLATWTTGSNSIGNINANIVTTLPNNQPFPKGVALKAWLGTVNALTNGELPISAARHNANVAAANTPSQTWIVADNASSAPNAAEYFSFNTPTNATLNDAGVPNYCGRVVFSDLHVGAASGDNPGNPIPAECAVADLSAQEKALEFMLFDLSSCVTVNDQPPAPPPVPTPPPPK